MRCDGGRFHPQLASLAELGYELSGVAELGELARLILRRFVELTHADRVLLVLADASGRGARVLMGVDGMGAGLPPEALDFDREVVDLVVARGEARELVPGSGPALGDAIIAAPLTGKRGVGGCLYAVFDREISRDALPIARLIASQATLALELHRRAAERRRADRVSMENVLLRRRSRKQSEQARVVEELNQRLTRTTTFLENLLESSTEHAIVAIDSNGLVTTWNTGAARTYGFSREEILGQRLDILLSEEDRSLGLLEEMVDRARGDSGRFSAETVRLKKDGGLINTQVALTAIRSAQGEVTGFLDVSRDVSAQHEMRRQLLLSEKMAALGTLAAGVAHEFNNLLQGITGYLEHALEYEDKENWGKAMHVALEAGNRASLLTRRLQTFACPQVTGLTATHLPDVVEDTFALIERSFGSEGVKLTRAYADDLPPAMADRSRLSQVLLNLLTNARHAVADSDRREVSVVVSGPEPDWLEIAVTDSGCGIPVEVQSRIFEPFFTTKGALGGSVFDGKIHGTGLGLAISSGIVTDHKGKMSVESREGEGTTFRVRLPAADADAARDILLASRRRHDASPTTRLSILVVDDEDVVRGWMRETLVSRGHRVVVAASGRQGLERFEEGAFDVVIADWRMPGMDGEQFFREVNAHANGSTRRVLITGRFESEEGKEFPSGLDALLRKPCTGADLVEAAEGKGDASLASGDGGACPDRR